MHLLNPAIDLAAFIASIQSAPRPVLMLDYDGTLAPFVVKRDQAVPYPGVLSALEAILASGRTRLVIVSGRAVDDLIPLLTLKQLPEIWGSHGWERRLVNGVYLPPELPAGAISGIERARAWATDNGFYEHLEIKPASISFHWRGFAATVISELKALVLIHWTPIALDHGLALKEFDGGLELAVPGHTKGDAVSRILADEPETALVAFLGDDRTDEDAFLALEGRGLRVLVRPEYRETAADLWLTPPAELLEFLAHWA